ncbi:hypothetical protein TYRP_012824 [Tyrophagus putrescentiae]|nr:hypothetical protein TYRP_012824 [Tyrophagus putrescentiae]
MSNCRSKKGWRLPVEGLLPLPLFTVRTSSAEPPKICVIAVATTRVVDARRLKGIIVEQLLEVGLSGAPGGAGARLDLPPVRRLEAAKVSSTGSKE